jgi:GT2 family glycosyltransferase
VLPLDEPFNWSRANNLAAETGTAPLLLFLNNDTKMLTTGWDGMLRTALSADDVGAVGATLLYPDHSIQHAGIIMGMGSGGPVHEGVGRPVDAGPGDRWRQRRSAAAVTGAFLAMRRDVFTAIDGFDAVNFAIAFNDIDLCLRVRAAGLRIVMASGIRVIHYESKTRGINATRSQVAWDLDELGRMHDRWGTALFDDPAYNPHWTRSGQPFDGYRFPSTREILRHIDLSARPAPWRPVVSHDASDRS